MKKTIVNLIAFLGVTILIASCTKTPEACFTVDKGKTAKENEEIQYDASCSKDADSYFWDFGDGSTGSGSPVKHKYPHTGNYVIMLTAHHSSKSATISQAVTIIK
ncbi:MAG: PKD domain-containing protein [Bacteroidia bacterium]